jgi:hypothetical protein
VESKMDRCKLEYMYKRFDIKKKKMIQLIDPYEDYEPPIYNVDK